MTLFHCLIEKQIKDCAAVGYACEAQSFQIAPFSKG